MCAVPHHMWRASGGKDGPAGPSPAAGGSCPSFPSRHAAAPTRCTPEGTPALRLLLRCAACRSCTTLVGMSPPMLRACGAACRLRCSAGDFYEMRARTRCARMPLMSAPSPCRCTPEGTPALRLLLRYAACRSCTTLVGMSPPMLRACSAACRLRSLLAISMRCVLARDARAHLSRLPPALAGVLPKVLLHCVPSCAAPPAAPALRWSVCPLPCCVRAVLPAACASLLAISMRCVLARAALAYLSCPPPALVAPSAATLHSASPSSASSASSASSTPLLDATSNASLPR